MPLRLQNRPTHLQLLLWMQHVLHIVPLAQDLPPFLHRQLLNGHHLRGRRALRLHLLRQRQLPWARLPLLDINGHSQTMPKDLGHRVATHKTSASRSNNPLLSRGTIPRIMQIYPARLTLRHTHNSPSIHNTQPLCPTHSSNLHSSNSTRCSQLSLSQI
jgi:hypothetical protein